MAQAALTSDMSVSCLCEYTVKQTEQGRAFFALLQQPDPASPIKELVWMRLPAKLPADRRPFVFIRTSYEGPGGLSRYPALLAATPCKLKLGELVDLLVQMGFPQATGLITPLPAVAGGTLAPPAPDAVASGDGWGSCPDCSSAVVDADQVKHRCCGRCGYCGPHKRARMALLAYCPFCGKALA